MNINRTMYEYALTADRGSREVMNYYGRAIKFDEFKKAVDSLALYFNEIGIMSGDSAVVSLPNTPSAVITIYALNKIGAIANIVYPLLPQDGLKRVIEETPCKAVFVNDVFYRKYKSVLRNVNSVVRCSLADFMPWYLRLPFKFGVGFTNIGSGGTSWSAILRRAKKLASSDKKSTANEILDSGNGGTPSGENIAVYLHSGGTSGEPKTVMLSNRALNAIAYNINSLNGHDLPPGTSMLAVLPIFHVFGLGVCMHSTVSAGARALILPRFNAKKTVALMRRERVTFVTGVPQMFAKMLKVKGFVGEYLREVKYCYCGGDKLSAQVIDEFAEAAESVGSKCVLSEGYGLTEAGICTVNTAVNYAPTSVGAPIGSVKIAVIDSGGNSLGAHVCGEICVGGSSVMSGYLGSDAESDGAFIVIGGEKFVRTGDYGYLDDNGRLFFKGRIKRTVKISGSNVFPAEIEEAAERLNIVEKAAAIGMTDNNGKPYVRLYVKLKSGVSETAAVKQVRDALASELMRYSVPREIAIINKIPYTKLGKIDYAALEEAASERQKQTCPK